MKILKLYIKNIASIEEADIDFEHGPLATEPIFLITGDTGAGKTTILNAIVIALYNKVPSLDAIEGKPDIEGIQTDNPMQLMRRGTGEAHIILTFEGNDRERYITEWHVHRAGKKASGKFQDIVRTLRTASGSKSFAKSEVKTMIQKLVGLSYEQFMRTTMLAQGQFSNFIKASGKEKAVILEKLTNTDIYTSIGKKIYAYYNEAEKTREILDAEIKSRESDLLSDTDRETLTSTIELLKQQITDAEAKANALQQQIDWLVQAERLQRQIASFTAEKQSAQTLVDSEALTAHRALIDRYEATADIRRKIKERTDAQQRLHSLRTRLDAFSTGPWHQILDGMLWLETKLCADSKALEEIRDALDRQSPYSSIYEQAPRIDQLSHLALAAHTEALDHTAKAKMHVSEIEKSQAKLDNLTLKVKDAASAVEAKAAEVSDKEEAMKGYDLNALNDKVTALYIKVKHIEDAINAVAQYQHRLTEHKEASKELEGAKAKLSDLSAQLEEAKSLRPQAQSKFDRLNGVLSGQMELKDHIAALRQRFADADECPLCGTHGAHLHTDEFIDSRVAQAQVLVAEAAKERQKILDLIAALENKIANQQTEIAQRERTSKRCRVMLDDAESAARGLAPDYQAEDCLVRLASEKSECEERREAASRLSKEALDRHNALIKAQKELANLQNALRQAEKNLDSENARIMDFQAEADKERSRSHDAAQRAQEHIRAIDEIITHGLASFREMLRDEAGIEVIDLSNVACASEFVSKKAKKHEELKSQTSMLSNSVTSLRESLDRCQNATADLTSRFGTGYSPRPVCRAALEADIRSLTGDVNKLDGEIQAANQQIQALTEAETQYFESSAISREEVDEISRLNETTITKYRQEVKAADAALKEAVTSLGVVEAQFAALSSQRPEIPDDANSETLIALKKEVDAERGKLSTDSAKNEERLANDAKIRSALADKHTLLKALKEEESEWKELNDLFGAKEGTRFREVAQMYVLQVLLGKANYYLRMISGRYRLMCDYFSLVIYVEDSHQGNAIRNVGSLSGGETFIVSLALALGLSSINQEKINVDTLFIDEGFGSLDSDTLETVVNTLDSLHQIGGRRIGIISHVEGLKTRIPTQLQMKRINKSASKVELVTL